MGVGLAGIQSARLALISTHNAPSAHTEWNSIMSYATTRREQYRAAVQAANDHYRDTGDLKGFQTLNSEARDTWHADIRAHFNNEDLNADLREALTQGGRVYATLNTGEIVRVHNVGNLYEVSDITGAPAEPLIARMAGGFDVKHTSLDDLISRA